MFRTSLIVSFFAGIGTLISLANQLLLAKLFGAGLTMDAYVVGISVPLFINGLVGGALSQLLVPVLQKSAADQANYNRLLRSLQMSAAGVGAIFAAAGLLCSKSIILHFLPRLSDDQLNIGVQSAIAGWVALPVALLAIVYTAASHVGKRFKLATFLQASPALGSILVCLVFYRTFGAAASAWGQLAGYVVWAVVAGIKNWTPRVSGFDHDNIIYIVRALPLTIIGGLIFGIYSISDAYWGAHAGPSAASYLGYGQRLVVALSGVAVIGATTVIFPKLSQHAAAGDFPALRKDVAESMRLVLVFTAPAAVLLSALAQPVIQVLLQRGSFDSAATRGLASLLPGLLIGMVPMSCMGIIFKAFYASRRIKTAATISVLGGIFYTTVSGALSQFFEAQGITASYALTWWMILGFSLRCLWKHEFAGAFKRNLRSFGFPLLVNVAVVTTIAFGGAALLQPERCSNAVFALLKSAAIVGAAASAYVFMGLTRFATPELRELLSRAIPRRAPMGQHT